MNAYELLAETVADLRAKIGELQAQLDAADAVTRQLLQDKETNTAEHLDRLNTVAWLIGKDDKVKLAEYVKACIDLTGRQ